MRSVNVGLGHGISFGHIFLLPYLLWTRGMSSLA